MANEEATSDARAMNPTANTEASNLCMIYPFCLVERGRYVAG
jgi:hypothetical protein